MQINHLEFFTNAKNIQTHDINNDNFYLTVSKLVYTYTKMFENKIFQNSNVKNAMDFLRLCQT